MELGEHEAVESLMTDADARGETLGWTEEQKEVLHHYLKLAWNQGYQRGLDAASPQQGG